MSDEVKQEQSNSEIEQILINYLDGTSQVVEPTSRIGVLLQQLIKNSDGLNGKFPVSQEYCNVLIRTSIDKGNGKYGVIPMHWLPVSGQNSVVERTAGGWMGCNVDDDTDPKACVNKQYMFEKLDALKREIYNVVESYVDEVAADAAATIESNLQVAINELVQLIVDAESRAKSYADEKDAVTLTSANAYTDAAVSGGTSGE